MSSPESSSHSTFIREHLANERTFLAWVRTALSLIGLGFVLARMGVFLRELGNAGAPHLSHRIPGGGEFIGTGVIFVVLGTLLGGWSGRRFHRVRRGIEESRFEPAMNVASLVTGAVVVGGLLIVGLVVWRIWIQGAES